MRSLKRIAASWNQKRDKALQGYIGDVLLSISQVPCIKLVRTTDGLESAEGGVPIADENYMTTRPAHSRQGDRLTSARTVVHAVEGFKNAVYTMMCFMEDVL